MINKISNIDTIYLLVDIFNYELSAKNVLTTLKNEQEELKLMIKNSLDSRKIISLNDINFELLPNGSKGYAYIIRNDGFEIKISSYKSRIENFSPLQIRISSEYLWSFGIEESWKMIYSWITRTFGLITQNKVSRVDLSTHVSGIDFITNFEESYKGHFKKYDKTFHTGKTINCITFGTRKGKNIYCRIYNKTLEIKETKKKSCFFEIWKNNGLDIDNVWNLEFELKSEFLRSIQVTTINDLLANIPKVWAYCTSEWLIKVDKINIRIDRCPINKDWLEIQKSFENLDNSTLIQRTKQYISDANFLIPNILGNITSFSAKINSLDLDNTLKQLLNNFNLYFRNKNTSFEEEVLRKAKLFNLKEEK